MGRKVNSNRRPIQNTTTESIADKILTENQKYLHENQFDIYAFCHTLPDLEVKELPLEDEISGYIAKKGNNFTIAINSKHSPFRKRFTLAHELGHYYLHKQNLEGIHQDTVLFRDSNEDNLGIEYAANDFASELLLPKEAFENAIATGQNTPKILSQLFQVSIKAVLYRAYKLGYMNEFPF